MGLLASSCDTMTPLQPLQCIALLYVSGWPRKERLVEGAVTEPHAVENGIGHAEELQRPERAVLLRFGERRALLPLGPTSHSLPGDGRRRPASQSHAQTYHVTRAPLWKRPAAKHTGRPGWDQIHGLTCPYRCGVLDQARNKATARPWFISTFDGVLEYPYHVIRPGLPPTRIGQMRREVGTCLDSECGFSRLGGSQSHGIWRGLREKPFRPQGRSEMEEAVVMPRRLGYRGSGSADWPARSWAPTLPLRECVGHRLARSTEPRFPVWRTGVSLLVCPCEALIPDDDGGKKRTRRDSFGRLWDQDLCSRSLARRWRGAQTPLPWAIDRTGTRSIFHLSIREETRLF